jgi:hypothetical protein
MSYDLAFYAYYYYPDDSDNRYKKLPIINTTYKCYFFTNNYNFYNELKETAPIQWTIIYDDVKIETENEGNMLGKYLKALPHKNNYLRKHDYLCYIDTTFPEINVSYVELIIDSCFIKKNLILALRTHDFIFNSVWFEFAASMTQKRYRDDRDKYYKYINDKINEGFKDTTTMHARTGYIIRNMKHKDVISLNEKWYEEIMKCGIQCQISFFFVKQLFYEEIFFLSATDEDLFIVN